MFLWWRGRRERRQELSSIKGLKGVREDITNPFLGEKRGRAFALRVETSFVEGAM